MAFGLHAGWAIEGAVGSRHKIDATYLSPHVNLAARWVGVLTRGQTGGHAEGGKHQGVREVAGPWRRLGREGVY